MATNEVEILEEISARRFRLLCAFCEGTGGTWDTARCFHTREPCSLCGGTGAVLIRLKGNLPFERCPRCKGLGRDARAEAGGSGRSVCKGCKGSGARPTAGHLEVVDQPVGGGS